MNKKLKALINTPVSLIKGLTVTMANMVRTKTTVKYPEVMPVPAGRGEVADPSDQFERPYEIGPRYRGLHGLTKDPETGDLNCIGCMACAKVCPDDLISMDLEKREGHSGRYPVTFTVNIGPCCFCGLCAEVCPTPMRAIVMTDLFEWATYRRDGRNLVLTKDDLIRHGELEVERRKGGRTWDESGELAGVLPEEEGNPYFQFAAEYEAERKKSEKPADGGQAKPKKGATEPVAPAEKPVAKPPVAADPMDAVREAFAAAGQALPADLVAFDLASLDEIEDRKVRAQLKSAVMKARKALGAEHQATASERSPAPQAPAQGDPLATVREAFAAVGRPLPADLEGFDLASLDDIDDRKLRAQLKSAIMKARKAAATGTPGVDVAAATPPVDQPDAAAAVEGGPAVEASGVPATSEAVTTPDDPTVLREAVVALLNEAGVPVPDRPETLSLEALDAIEDRKLRGRAKSALRKLQKSLGLVD